MRVSGSKLRRVANLGLVFLAVLVAVFAVLVYRGEEADTATSQASPFQIAPTISQSPRVDALFVGDSFTSGAGGIGLNSYPYVVCRANGWNCNIDAQGSTGFINDGAVSNVPGRVPFIDRIESDAANFNVDLLIVDGGRNDLGLSPDPVGVAIRTYMEKARSLWPKARIVMIVPAYASVRIAENYAPLQAKIDEVARSVDASVIDPVAEGWYQTPDLGRYLIEDGVHFNIDGNQYFADKLTEALARVGVSGETLGFTPVADGAGG